MKHIAYLMYVLFCIFQVSNLKGQSYDMPAGTGSSTEITCVGSFFDANGFGVNYPNNSNATQTFCTSIPGQCITVSFTDFSVSFNDFDIFGDPNDFLEVYDGPIVDPGTYMFSISGGPFPSTFPVASSGGCLTFRFVSNGTKRDLGWRGDISCQPCPIPVAPAQQDCNGAIPVCEEQYYQPNGYLGNNGSDIVPATSCLQNGEVNNSWYVFTAESDGILSFVVSPNFSDDDYDWAVYNITSTGCEGISNGTSPEISCNYSSNTTTWAGQTGANGNSPFSGTGSVAGAGGSPFNGNITAISGNTYAILVSNFSASQGGYFLDLSQSTQSLFNASTPNITQIHSLSCFGNQVKVVFSEPVLCSSLQATDFVLTGPGGPFTISGITLNDCSGAAGEFVLEIILTISPSITINGNYTVCLTNVSGGITDVCGSATTSGCFSFSNVELTTYAHGTNPTCATNCNGTAVVDVVGGTAPYTYLWSNGANTQSISSLCGGSYSVTVTDANGCQSISFVPAQGCFQIQGILVDACSTNEYQEEMVFFQTGTSPLNTSTLTVTWPTNVANPPTAPWLGLCTNPTFIANVNATITGGGILLPVPVSGILPANSNVVLITSNSTTSSLNSFANLSDTLYVMFQCAGNTIGHFGNYGTPAAIRTLALNFGNGCSDVVSYNIASLINITGTTGGNAAANNGASVLYSSSGIATYTNYGCVIPYTTQSNSVTLSAPAAIAAPVVNDVSYCLGESSTPLTATGTNLLWYTAATGGVGSATAPTPSTAVAGTFTYYVSQTVSPCESPRASITVTVSSGGGITPTFTLPSALCNGASAPILPLISNNGVSGTWAPATVSNTSTGTYTFTPTTACAANFVISITVSPPIVIYAHGTNPTCATTCNGSATVDVVGGTLPYTYSWSNGSNSQSITSLCGGIYTVTVTDDIGCISSTSFVPATGCFQIQGILVDACSTTEYQEEMVFFQTGTSPLNTSALTVTWPTYAASPPTDPWQGLCTNPTFISNINATITGGGILLPLPVSGILPANSNVVLVTSNSTTSSLNSFANLSDTLYVMFQCAGNTTGHFGNYNSTSAIRTLTLNFGSGCSDVVSYNVASLINITGTNGGNAAANNGASVLYSSSGTATYTNYSCVIPYTTQSSNVTLTAPAPVPVVVSPIAPIICSGANAVITASGATSYVWSPSTGLSATTGATVTANPTTTTTYTVTGTLSGCTGTASSLVTVLTPTLPTLSPATACAGSASTFIATNGSMYEFTLNGNSQGPPSSTNTFTSPALAAGDQVCVKSYPVSPFVFDGNISELEWGAPLATSFGGPASSGFGAGNNLDALYINNAGGFLNGAIASNLVNNSNNRILLFIDCQTGGFNSLSSWTVRTNSPYYSVENLSSNITFDAGFTADYVLAMNQASANAFFDLYNMVGNSNNFIGNATASTLLGFIGNAGVGNFTQGFEFSFPLSAIGNPTGTIKFFAMMVNDPGIAAPTFISNQFLTPAGPTENNYGSGLVNFAAAVPDPISYTLNPDCFQQTCVTAATPTIPTFNTLTPFCVGQTPPLLPATSTNGITGTWLPTTVNNSSSATYNFTPNAGQCATGATINSIVTPSPLTTPIYHD